MSSSLFDYYRQQHILPTEGGLETADELAAHERERGLLFTRMLGLPPACFRGARLLEIGPDAGGNSLVFALWGAECTLSEPHTAAHERIRRNFDRFGLEHRLVALLDWDVESFPAPERDADRYDIVDAEGFIYTVRPPSRWIAKLAEVTRTDGFAVVSYYASWGGLIELLTKALHARYRALCGASGIDAASTLFATKWQMIPHRRPLASWAMDVLENPFVRFEYFLDPAALCAGMLEQGFRLHASWPRYDGGFEVHWFKRTPSARGELERHRDFVARSCLSYFLGRPHFLVERDPALEDDLLALLEVVDDAIDTVDSNSLVLGAAALNRIGTALRSDRVLSSAEDRERSSRTLASVGEALDLLSGGSAADLARFCNEDGAFLESWGSPAHHAAFQRVSIA